MEKAKNCTYLCDHLITRMDELTDGDIHCFCGYDWAERYIGYRVDVENDECACVNPSAHPEET